MSAAGALWRLLSSPHKIPVIAPKDNRVNDCPGLKILVLISVLTSHLGQIFLEGLLAIFRTVLCALAGSDKAFVLAVVEYMKVCK